RVALHIPHCLRCVGGWRVRLVYFDLDGYAPRYETETLEVDLLVPELGHARKEIEVRVDVSQPAQNVEVLRRDLPEDLDTESGRFLPRLRMSARAAWLGHQEKLSAWSGHHYRLHVLSFSCPLRPSGAARAI